MLNVDVLTIGITIMDKLEASKDSLKATVNIKLEPSRKKLKTTHVSTFQETITSLSEAILFLLAQSTKITLTLALESTRTSVRTTRLQASSERLITIQTLKITATVLVCNLNLAKASTDTQVKMVVRTTQLLASI